MEFKRKDRVQYLGSEIVLGTVEGTDDLFTRQMQPINGTDSSNHRATHTYIHGVIESQRDGNLYIIQHNDGVVRDFFIHNERVFGKVNINVLDPKNKYIYVSASDLVLVDENNNPINLKPQPIEDDIPSSNSRFKEEDIPVDNKETKPEVPVGINGSDRINSSKENISILHTKEEVGIDINKPNISTAKPHFTKDRCNLNLMVQVMPIDKIYRTMKQPEPFTVELASNKIQEGNGGDYLMLSAEGNVFIEPKETYDKSFTNIKDNMRVEIGSSKFIVPMEVKNYIEGLEQLNKEVRDKLFLLETTKG